MSEPTPDEPVSLYVYYKVTAEQRDAALAAITRLQTELVRDMTGLHASLMVRADDPSSAPSTDTWMEVYRPPKGLNPELDALLTQRVQALPPGLIGQRHTERFVALSAPA